MIYSNLTLSEKLDLVKDLVVSHDISAYEISKNTSFSIFGIECILKGKTKKPRKDTLDKILDYLNSLNSVESNYDTSDHLKEEIKNRRVAEAPSEYKVPEFNNLKIDDKLNIIFKQLNVICKSLALSTLYTDNQPQKKHLKKQ